MGSLIELLATKKKGATAAPENTVLLPVLHKEHEGSCGTNCDCGANEESACCGG